MARPIKKPAVSHGGCDRCFYCRHYLPTRHEHDHVPVPQLNDRRRGQRWVPACLNCHDLKDRLLLADWPVGLVSQAISQLEHQPTIVVPSLARLTFHAFDVAVDRRGVFIELGAVTCQALADDLYAAIETLPFPGNLLLATLACISFAFQAGQQLTGSGHACEAE